MFYLQALSVVVDLAGVVVDVDFDVDVDVNVDVDVDVGVDDDDDDVGNFVCPIWTSCFARSF